MARNNDRDRDRGAKRAPKDDKRRVGKKKPSPIQEGAFVDYKDINLLRKFMSDRGKIRARRVTGLSAQVQRDVAIAIKTARELALLPYANRNINERAPRAPRAPRESRYEAEAEDGVVDDEDVADVDLVDEEV